MRDELIEILEGLGYTAQLQGSLAKDEPYPEAFFTFWNDDTPGAEFYDNDARRFEHEFTVYFYEGSKGYHSAADCVGMTGAPAHTLAEAVAAGKSACGNCNPPSGELVGLPVLWMDDSNLCHTSDTCADFNGHVRLILRDDALAQGLSACPNCGAADYLVPGTVLAEK